VYIPDIEITNHPASGITDKGIAWKTCKYQSMETIKSFTAHELKHRFSGNRKLLRINKNLISGIWIWYSVEDRLLFSEGFSLIAGISKNAFNNFKTFFEIIYGNDLLQFLNDIEKMLQGAPPQWTYIRIVRPNKTICELYCYMESITTEFSDIFDIAGICFDITE